MLDVFNSDAFSVVSLTEAINLMPYKPSRLGQMGLFANKPINTTTAVLEYKENRLGIIPTQARGSHENVKGGGTRIVKAVKVPHLPLNSTILADDVQGVRRFGSEDETEGVAEVVNDRLQELRQDHEVTWEYHRAGAINGVVLDADGTTEIVNLFDLFSISQTEVEFDFSDEDTVKLAAQSITRTLRHALGGIPFSGIHAFCGDGFFDALVTSDAAKAAYNRWQDGAFLRELQGSPNAGFTWCGITWENYDGYFNDSLSFIETNEARIIPTGSPQLFQVAIAPADFVETVNTVGQPFYAKQERMKFDKGIDIHTQSNPLHYCTRPQALLKGVFAGSTSG